MTDTDEERMQALAESFERIQVTVADWLQAFAVAFNQMAENVTAWYEQNEVEINQRLHAMGKPELVEALQRIRDSVRVLKGE